MNVNAKMNQFPFERMPVESLSYSHSLSAVRSPSHVPCASVWSVFVQMHKIFSMITKIVHYL